MFLALALMGEFPPLRAARNLERQTEPAQR